MVIKAYLPVTESFGFDKDLRCATFFQAFLQMIFDHLENIAGDAFDATTKTGETVKAIKKRKSLSEDVPDLSRYLDKL
jgi:elongation factor 2